MYKYNAGFIGAGHMGGILAGVAAKTAGPDKVAVACSTEENSKKAADKIGCSWDTAEEILKNSEYIILGMRPAHLDGFVQANSSGIEGAHGIFISMLSGVSISVLEESVGYDKKIIRIMPNTPCDIGKGLIGYARNKNVGEKDAEGFKALFAPAGFVEEIPEKEMDIFSVIAACAPAYTYFFADALARGGERCGIDKEKAIKYVAQTLMGSAGMMMRDKSPEELKNEVCTPGGTTIEGVRALENGGFEALVAEAVKSSYNKTVGNK